MIFNSETLGKNSQYTELIFNTKIKKYQNFDFTFIFR